MIGLEVRFLTGRFHGNRWQNAHNEGVAEWPPSPWRLLRALVAASYDLDVEAQARTLIELLGAAPPSYQLPAARQAHTRHYMPDVDDSKHKKTKVFDAFVVIDGARFYVRRSRSKVWWPKLSLSEEERALLQRLARRVAYVGRAESWAEMDIVSEDRGNDFDCWPDETSAAPSTTLMALESPETFQSWVQGQTSCDAPRSRWDVLTFDGERFTRQGWSKVPGTQLVRYVFSRQPFEATSMLPRKARSRKIRPTVARFAIRSAVLPRMQNAIIIAERMRQGLMSQSKTISGNARPVFSGHFEEGVVRQHEHAFIFPSADFNDERRIDTITVTAKMGFDVEDLRALQQTRRLYGRGEHFLDLVLLGVGNAADFGGASRPRSRLLHESTTWESLTPFVLTRHPKRVRGRDVDDVRSQVSQGCAQLGLPEPVSVEALDGEWHKFHRRRRFGKGRRGPDRAYGVRLVFSKAVRGPIAIGYGAHCGLGLFTAA
ncbi:MAG: type I-U CRISPR-associated protein Cas5/Cas6 [Deltaproteobacteria bacterium]|nr:type I-U CRISPR-associated protein Cas5/Cas6 [Deltaproteobacteria bacterium]